MSRKLSDSHVRDFYASGGGEKMFVREHATPAIQAYLEAEARAIVQVFEQLSPKHLFEVGCGTGSYLDWAERQHVDYDGVDLVSHLVEAGRKRLSGSARTRQKLHVGSCREVASLFTEEGLTSRGTDVVVLFPFNCFGNVAEPSRVVHSLRRTGARVLVSGFLPTPDRHGVLFTSAEGLHSWGMELPVLDALFEAEGFRLARRDQLGPIATASLFEPAS